MDFARNDILQHHRPDSFNTPDATIREIRDIKVPKTVERDVVWKVELCRSGRAAVAAVCFCTIAHDGGDNISRIDCSVCSGSDFANTIVECIRDVEISGGIKSHSLRGIELGRYRRATVAGRTWFIAAECAIPRDRGYRPGKIHLSDYIVVSIGNVKVTGRVYCEAVDKSDLG
jgi:hypothetical protein